MRFEIEVPEPEYGHPAELAMIQRLRDHGPELIEQYLAKETRYGVSFIARDAAKRLFSEYNQDPVGNNRYSDRAASSLADAARRFILEIAPKLPRNEVIIFTGAPASGKSAAGRPIDVDTVEIVHETIFTSLDKPRALIQAALDAGRRPAISLVYTSDPRINVRRMIDRAQRIGRTVPVAFMAKACSDNSATPGEVFKHQDIDRVFAVAGRYTKKDCLREMDDELDQIDKRGGIPAGILYEAGIR